MHNHSRALIAIGNEAGDLDSIVSAIAFASLVAHESSAAQQAPSATTLLALPVAPFTRRDFKLRNDALLLFRHVALPLDSFGAPVDLTFFDELESADAWRRPPSSLALALTDHNACKPVVSQLLGDEVVAIVDHHDDERCHVETTTPSGGPGAAAAGAGASSLIPLRVIEPGVGSACTLITELIVEPPDAKLSVLLLGTIAVDTRGFKAKHLGTKFSSRDVAAVRKLFGWLGLQTAHEELDRAASLDEVGAAASHLRKLSLPQEARVGGAADFGKLAKVLLDARHDVSTFTTAELLRLDYKEAVAGKLRVGVASVSLCADELIRRSGGEAGLDTEMAAEAAARGGLDLLFAITPAPGDGKSLVVYRPTPPPMGSNELLSALEGTPRLPPRLAEQSLFVAQGISEHGLGVRWVGVPDAPSLLVTDMRGVVSRKTLLPLIIQLGSESSGIAP